jgi:hypothetical protein
MFISSAIMGLTNTTQNQINALRERRTNSITGPTPNKSGAHTSLAYQSQNDPIIIGNQNNHGRIKQSVILQ